MTILGIETSCDETAAAVVKDGRKLLSNVVASQIDTHREFGGVVPEVAAREHTEIIVHIVQKALDEAKLSWNEIDAIGVTKGPGLPGALLVGTLTAKALAHFKDKPIYGVDHVEAHAYANFLTEKPPEFPILALIVSGGHSQIVLFKDHGKYEVIGRTRDDAVGEAFDKVGKLLGLPFPGGPAIAEAALDGDPEAYSLPVAKLDNPYDFSFSGLKTAVLRHVQSLVGKDHTAPSHTLAPLLNQQQINDTAASFQENVVSTMSDKINQAFEEFNPKSVIIAGGVAANKELRARLQQTLPIDMSYAPPHLCTDNAAMIAALAFYQSQLREADNPLTLESNPSLSM